MKQLLPGLIWQILWIFSWLPGFVFRFLASAVNYIVLDIFGYRKGVVHSNLKKSFPELSSDERQEIAKKFYKHFSELFLEIILLTRFNSKKAKRRLRFSDPEVLAGPLSRKQNIIIVGGHFGNWEYNVPMMIASGYRVLAVYKPQSSEFANQLMKKIRQRPGVTLVPMKDSFRIISSEINNKNSPFALLLVADQTPARVDIRFRTRFLNQDTAFFTGVEKISKIFSMPVYFVEQLKHGFADYEASLTLIHDGVSTTQKGDVTKKFVDILEKSIRKTPYLWLWSHRRWKYQPVELPLKP